MGITREEQRLTSIYVIGIMAAVGLSALVGDEAMVSTLAQCFVGILLFVGLIRYYHWRKFGLPVSDDLSQT